MPTHTATLAIAPDGNWSLTCTHPKFPPIAIPATMTAPEAQAYARNLLFCAKVTSAAQTELVEFVQNGYTRTPQGHYRAAYRAEFATLRA